MSNILFMYDNLLDTATLTASSAASGFPADNLKNPFRSKPWRTAGTPAGTANIVMDLRASWINSGANLITNGDFSSALGAEWKLSPGAGGGSIAIDAGSLKFTQGVSAWMFASQSITTVPGGLYLVNVNCKSATYSANYLLIKIGTTQNGGQISSTTCVTTGIKSIYFIAVGTTTWITLADGQGDAATSTWDDVSVYLKSGGEASSIALIGYNWASAPETLDLEFSLTDSWTPPAATEVVTWAASPSDNGNPGIIVKCFTSRSYPYARLNVAHSPGDWDLGRIFIGSYFEPAAQHLYGHTQAIVDDSMLAATIGGQDHADEVAKYRNLAFSFNIRSQAQWELFQKMINAVGKTKDLLIAMDYTNEPDEMTIYGKFTELPVAVGVRSGQFDAAFAFRESR